jgi:ribosome-associated protein YbcJ (S4-like RNA binding protein)
MKIVSFFWIFLLWSHFHITNGFWFQPQKAHKWFGIRQSSSINKQQQQQVSEKNEKIIKLEQFLKLAHAGGTTGEIRELLKDGVVAVNGEVEFRRGRKLHVDKDIVSVWKKVYEVATFVNSYEEAQKLLQQHQKQKFDKKSGPLEVVKSLNTRDAKGKTKTGGGQKEASLISKKSKPTSTRSSSPTSTRSSSPTSTRSSTPTSTRFSTPTSTRSSTPTSTRSSTPTSTRSSTPTSTRSSRSSTT